MNCEQVAHNLDAYVRGETPTGLTGEIAHHLESCAVCREEEALARKIAGGMRGLRRTAPAGLADRIIASAPEARASAPPRRLGWFTPVRAMAATLLVVAALALTKEGRHFFTDEGFREMTVPAPAAQTKDLAPPPPGASPSPTSPEASTGGATDGRPSRERQDAASSRGGAGIADERAEAEQAAPTSRAPQSSLGTSRRTSSGRTSARPVLAPAAPEPLPQSGYLKSAPPAAAAPASSAPLPRPAASMTAPSPVSSSAAAAEIVATEDESGDEEAAMNELRMLRSDEDAAYRYRTRGADPDANGAAASATSDSSAASDSAPTPPAEVTDSTATDSPARR